MARIPSVTFAAALTVLLLGTSCSSSTPSAQDSPGADVEAETDVRLVAVSARAEPVGDASIAGAAISELGADLFTQARLAAPADNITLSPTSIAIALALLEPGAINGAQQQLRDVLHIENSDTFHTSMNALEQSLESRTPPVYDDFGDLTIQVANAAYLQQGYPFEPSYLDTIGTHYGPILSEVDFRPDPDAAAHEINGWVADQTEGRIPNLIADGVLTPDTVLALVNALYFKASWLTPFSDANTLAADFTRLDGTKVEVSMMSGQGNSSSSGDGWVGATKAYSEGLAMQFILPDVDRFDEIAENLGDAFAEYPAGSSSGTTLAVPRFESRSSFELSDVLKSIGLTDPYVPGNLLGVAPDPSLVVTKVIHETFIAVDEQGTEAAAATAVIGEATSGPANPPVPVILDRPFLYRIVDNQTGATLFIGQITDPVAS